MSVGEQAQLAAADVEGPSRRPFLAPHLDAYELRRLVLIGGCIAAAAVANFAGSALPQHAPVAVGAALLGALLVLRRRQTGGLVAAESDLTAVEAVEVPSGTGLPRSNRRGRATQAAAL